MKMKRTTALLLALAMLLTLTTTAFAQSIIPTADKLSVKKGDQVKVTTTVEEAISGVCTAEFRVFYDDTLFDYDYETTNAQEKTSGIIIAKPDASKDPAHCVRYTYNAADVQGASFTAGQKLATLVFTAKEDVTASKTAAFTSKVHTFDLVDGSEIEKSFSDQAISITVTPAEVEGYTVSAAAVNPTVTVGEKAQVSLTIGNKDVTTYNAYYLEVSYDSSVLTYESINHTKAEVKANTNGTLKIAGYGDNKTCGTDNIVLTFTGKAVGETKVTVTSAKVDTKANAAEKDAPAATIDPATAVVTVTGYQVNLSDDFTGAGTAAPGKDYTFTVKDASLKYDFTGSTMDGKAVEVINNGNGTYTVKNVTGPLVIKAVALVTIEETGNGWGDVVSRTGWTKSGDTVKAGASNLAVMIQPKDNRTYTVTANGTVLSGLPMQGGVMVRYAIPAEQVKGEKLTISVTYTESSADSITIIETGDAWGDVTLRGTWPEGGGTIDKSVADGMFTLKLKPASDKTKDNYVVTVNGKEMTLTNMKKGEWGFNFTPSEVAEDGKITIDVSYKKPSYTVTVSEYVKLDKQSIFLITATGNVADGNVLAYSGSQMYWSDKYNEGKGAYAWLVISGKTLDEVKAEAATAVTAVTGTKSSIAYDGDVNLTGSVDINDAQLVWNMYNAEYSDFQAVNVRKFLEADMTADGKLDTADATAITAKFL